MPSPSFFHTERGARADGSTDLRRSALLAFMARLSVHFLAGGHF